MYRPAHFHIDDPSVIHAFIRAHPLGLLISAGDDGPLADPLPFLLDDLGNGKARLRGHMARANPHWRLLETMGRALVVFQASGHYISPGWYPSKAETGKVVPTWNYVNVQVRGPVRVHNDAAWLRQQVQDLTAVHEGASAAPWAIEDAPEDFIAAQLRAIIGFEIEIEAMDGKFKLSQNRSQPDRNAVLRALDGAGAGKSADLAALMRSLGIGD